MDRAMYLDFELKLERCEGYYAVSVIHSPAGEASGTFTQPFSDLERENFLLKLGRTRRGVRRIGSPEEQAARDFGGRLFDAVFTGNVRGCFRSSLDKATLEHKGLRVKLRLLDAPELADLPWEYLYNPALNRFLSLSAQTPIVRYIELPEPIPPMTVKPPLCILVMVSSPSGYPQLDVEREKANLREALGDLEGRGMVKLDWLEEATLRALQRRLRRARYHIFHFIGHGGFDERAQDGLLLLEDEQGRGRPVSGQHLGVMLHDERTLRLAVLNACEGARSSLTDPFAGTAMTLVQQGIPAVVAMQSEITDDAAIVFAREFYAAIADGYPVDASLAEARKAIFATPNDVEWGKPVLYMRSPDGQIFGVEPIGEEEREALARAAHEEQVRRQAELSVLYSSGLEALEVQDWPTAIEQFKALLALDASHRDAATMLAEARKQLEREKEEERQRMEAQRRERERQEQLSNLYAQGIGATERSDWEGAIAAFKEVVTVDDKYRDAAARLAAAEIERGKAEEAREREKRVATLYSRAEERYRKGKWSEARELYGDVLALEPGYSDAESKLAEAQCQQYLADQYAQTLAHLQAERWQEAIECLEAILRLDAGYRDAPTRLTKAREALAAEVAARDREMGLADLYERAMDRMQACDWSEAEQLLREIQLVDSTYQEVEELLKQVSSELEQKGRLATLFRAAEDHYGRGEWDQAVELYGQALALQPGYRDVEAKLAGAQRQRHLSEQYAQALEHRQAQRWEQAIEGFRVVLEGDPTYKDAAALLAEARHQKELAGLPKPPSSKPAPPRGRKPSGLPR